MQTKFRAPFRPRLLCSLVEFICISWRYPQSAARPINFKELP